MRTYCRKLSVTWVPGKPFQGQASARPLPRPLLLASDPDSSFPPPVPTRGLPRAAMCPFPAHGQSRSPTQAGGRGGTAPAGAAQCPPARAAASTLMCTSAPSNSLPPESAA